MNLGYNVPPCPHSSDATGVDPPRITALTLPAAELGRGRQTSIDICRPFKSISFHSIVLFQATRPVQTKQRLDKKTENQYKEKDTSTEDTKTPTHTHTHPFNGPLSGTTQVSRYHKGKTNLDFTGARDSEWQWHQLGHMQICTSLQTDNHASTPPLTFFTGRMPFLPPNQQCQSTESKKNTKTHSKTITTRHKKTHTYTFTRLEATLPNLQIGCARCCR